MAKKLGAGTFKGVAERIMSTIEEQREPCVWSNEESDRTSDRSSNHSANYSTNLGTSQRYNKTESTVEKDTKEIELVSTSTSPNILKDKVNSDVDFRAKRDKLPGCLECGRPWGYASHNEDMVHHMGSGRKRLARSSYSAPTGSAAMDSQQPSAGTLDATDSAATSIHQALPSSTTTAAPVKSRKISLSCLVTSVLNFERGRRRASRAREEELLQSAEVGDLLRVKRLCERDVGVNIACTDPLGRTPLHLAVANEQKEVVQYLLGHVDMKALYQALMLAINLGHDEIAEMIIEHPLYEEISSDIRTHGQATFHCNTFNDDTQFLEAITPLILAAQQNRFEIVMALLMKGEVIGKPHKYSCFCDACVRSAKADELKFAKARLNAYKGLASEAYISLSSEDPILTSFELRRELINVCTDEKYYTSEYTTLADQLSEYVVRLLDKVHGNEELNAILNASEEKDEDSTLPRLQLAIEYKEKKFVAHPSCQKKLTSMWYADFTAMLKSRSGLFSVMFIMCITFFYPVLALIYIVYPIGQCEQILRTPIVKFVAQAASFVLFLCLILTHSYNEQTKLCTQHFTDDPDVKRHWDQHRKNISSSFANLNEMCIRNYSPSFLEILILLWISGLVWQECKQVYSNGYKVHFLDVYNHMDFFMLKFYISSMGLRQMQHIIVTNAYDYFTYSESWNKLLNYSDEAMYKLYFLNADRYYWDAWDPYHVSEALFAVGNILNFTRLFYLLAISENLGPMLISLERMLKDVMKFFVAFIPIFISFMVGLYNMYWYYAPANRGRVELVNHNITTRAESAFGSLELTFRTVYWSLFGLKDAKLVELQDWKKVGVGYDGRFTERVGYIVFGVYNWGAVIVLLNMLIAMMTRSFEKITIHQDIEWKFARSKLYMEYIEVGSTLPVPFNLVPSCKSLKKCMSDLLEMCDMPRLCKKRHARMRKGEDIFITVSTEHDEVKPNGDCRNTYEEAQYETTYLTNETIKQSSNHPPDETQHTQLKEPSTGRNNLNGGSQPNRMKSRGSFAWGDNPGDKDDYRTVVKRVVRRYIFEHLQATVGGEGANEQQNAEAMRQEFHGVHQEINSIKPKFQTEFERVRAEMCDIRLEMRTLQESLQGMHHQLGSVLQACRDITHNQGLHYSNQAPPPPLTPSTIYETTQEHFAFNVGETADNISPPQSGSSFIGNTKNSTIVEPKQIPSKYTVRRLEVPTNLTSLSARSEPDVNITCKDTQSRDSGFANLPSYDTIMRQRRKSCMTLPSPVQRHSADLSLMNAFQTGDSISKH